MTIPADPKTLEEQVAHYYRHVEDYDWTRAAERFIGLETIFHRARCRETLKLVEEVGRDGRYLDVGCGTALITRLLPPGTIGIDLNPRNLQKAKLYATNARFVLCDAEDAMPLRDRSFDVVVCTEMLEHLLYPLQALGEVHRVLKPKGILIGSVPGRSLIWKLRGLSNSSQSFEEEPYHKHYNREEVKTLLSQHFQIRRLYSRYLQMNWFFKVMKTESV